MEKNFSIMEVSITSKLIFVFNVMASEVLVK